MTSNRFMRLVLFFDLPVVKKAERKAAQKFARDIKKLGFYMLQESVYVKLNMDTYHSNAVIKQLKEIKPAKGSIMLLNVTENQFQNMEIILGDYSSNVINNQDRIIEL